MSHFLILAGIPAEIYDAVLSAGDKKLASGDGKVISEPLHPMASDQYRYSESYANQLMKTLKNGVEESLVGSPDKKLYKMFLYINYEDNSTTVLVRRFLPFTLPRRLNPLQLLGLTGRQKRELKNTLIEEISAATKQMRKNLNILRNELTSGANRTPLLLPFRNFRSKYLIDMIKEIGHTVATKNDPDGVIRKARVGFERLHPRVTLGRDPRRYFADDRKLVFKTPGKDRHARHQDKGGHQPECLFGSRNRLGAPFDPKFHYDCRYENCSVSGDFMNCHDLPVSVGDCSHINIAPNDHVRG